VYRTVAVVVASVVLGELDIWERGGRSRVATVLKDKERVNIRLAGWREQRASEQRITGQERRRVNRMGGRVRKGDVYGQFALTQDWKDGEEGVELRGPLKKDCMLEGDLQAPPRR